MRNFALVTFALASACLLPACVAERGAVDDDSDEENVASISQEDRGSSGSNGLDSVPYLQYRNRIGYLAMKYPFLVYSGGVYSVNPAIYNAYNTTGWQQEVFSYIFACVVPDTGTATINGTTYYGRGHLAFGTQWYSAPLKLQYAQELVACVTAHVNPYHIHVPIQLHGPDIKSDTSQFGFYYPVQEALWTVKLNADWVPTVTVYPFSLLQTACGQDIYAEISNRVCGQSPSSCNLVLGDVESCTSTLEGYYCDGQPAIGTNVLDTGFTDLYPSCEQLP
ncbi:MAG: hypothetical protein U0441_00615 [Polyangiaceae bacterium]